MDLSQEVPMALTGKYIPFTKENVDKAPAKHGVYELYDKDNGNYELIYIGKASGKGVTIRSRLQSHLRGDEGPCTKTATHYRRKEMMAAAAILWEEVALQEYEEAHKRLPRCNDRLP